MMKTLTQLTVFASGTSETESERFALRRVVEELNKQLEKAHNITLRILAWPDDVRPGVNSYSQAELNHQLGDKADIYLGVLGSRFGTPTPYAGSGTEEEFTLAFRKHQANSQSIRILFYFKRSAENIFTLDQEQFQKVMQFRKTLADNGVVYRDFNDTSEFVQQTREHLYNLIIEEWKDERWIQIEGLGQPPVSKESTAGAETVSDETSELAEPVEDAQPLLPVPKESTAGAGAVSDETSELAEPVEDAQPLFEGAEPEDPADKLELGFLEYMEEFYKAVPALVDTFEQISRHTTRMNEQMRARTTESESLQEEQNRLKGVGGSRAQQELVGRAKKVVNAAADDLNEYAESMGGALGQYRTHSRAMFGSYRFALQSGKELWTSQTKEENRTAIKEMIGAMETALQSITKLQRTIMRIPALTGRFKQARNRTAEVLGELVAEITFSISEANQILPELGNTETEAA